MAYRKQAFEEVDNLFNAEHVFKQARLDLTPALIEEYRSRVPYGFAIERQSMGRKVMGDVEKTGHIARVEAILRMAERAKLWLPDPLPRPNRQHGDTPFLFDEWYWFVDGESERASGHTFSPQIRPRFWMLYCLARRLNEIAPDAKPAAILVADVKRFTRQDGWLKSWVDAMQNEGVQVYFDGFEKLGRLGLTLLEIDIQFSSEVLPKAWKAAREIARKDGRIMQHRRPFGLKFTAQGGREGTKEPQGAETWTVPEEWAVLAAVAHGLADGTILTGDHAGRFSREQFGKLGKTAAYWRKVFDGESFLYTGEYIGYQYDYQVCRLKQRHGHLSEINYTKNGNRRLVARPTDPSTWVIQQIRYSEGTAPIPPAVLAKARRRVSEWGRPPQEGMSPHRQDCILPPRLVHCACCGSSIMERNPHPTPKLNENRKKTTSLSGWTLHCTCAQRLAHKLKISQKEAGQRPECQHRRLLAASLSRPLKQLLTERLFSGGFDPAQLSVATPAEVAAEREALLLQEHQAHAKLEQLAEQLTDPGVIGLPVFKQKIMEAAKAAEKEIEDAQRRLEILAAQLFTGRNDQSRFERARRVWERMATDHMDDNDWWREIVEALVEEVTVDLDAKTFVARVNLKHPALEELIGALWEHGCEKETTASYRFSGSPFTLRGDLDLRLAA